MKLAAAALLLAALGQARDPVSPEPRFFRYQRLVFGSASGKPGPFCAVLPGELYAHSPTLADVRLYNGLAETPYALSTSETAATSDPARVLNAGMQGGRLLFDLSMPPRPYTDVNLDLVGTNFVATATVTGRQSPSDTAGTALGSFTLFDLSGTGLGRSTTLKLVESTFPILHVELAVSGAGGRPFALAPAMIAGADVPPSRQAQIVYTPVAVTSTITQVGRHSVANFHLPAHVPVERVSFTLAPGDRTNFSREVSVLAHAEGGNPQDPEARESVAGTISRIRMTEGSRELREDQLSVPATLGANIDRDADVQVWVENGDDKPLALASVQLEMRQRLLCFEQEARYTLRYGDPALSPPVYDYARTFDPSAATVADRLGPEILNPDYTPRPVADHQTLTDRHPELLWAGLLIVVAALGLVAFRSAKKI